MSQPILVLNCGSSSIKFALFDAAINPLPRKALWSDQVDGIGGPLRSYRTALLEVRAIVEHQTGGRPPAATVHRVVHGGAKYAAPVHVDAAVLADLKSYIPLAPLHQPFALEALELYVRRIVREIGALTAVLGGLGLELDRTANDANAPTISRAGSRVLVAVEPTNEEWIAACHAVRVLSSEASDVPQF